MTGRLCANQACDADVFSLCTTIDRKNEAELKLFDAAIEQQLSLQIQALLGCDRIPESSRAVMSSHQPNDYRSLALWNFVDLLVTLIAPINLIGHLIVLTGPQASIKLFGTRCKC